MVGVVGVAPFDEMRLIWYILVLLRPLQRLSIIIRRRSLYGPRRSYSVIVLEDASPPRFVFRPEKGYVIPKRLDQGLGEYFLYAVLYLT